MISTTIWRFSFIQFRSLHWLLLFQCCLASVLISLSFSTRSLLCSVLCHHRHIILSLSLDCRDERAIKFMQLFFLFFLHSSSTVLSRSRMLPVVECFIFLPVCITVCSTVVVFGVFRLTPLTFYLELGEDRWLREFSDFFLWLHLTALSGKCWDVQQQQKNLHHQSDCNAYELEFTQSDGLTNELSCEIEQSVCYSSIKEKETLLLEKGKTNEWKEFISISNYASHTCVHFITTRLREHTQIWWIYLSTNF